MSPDVALMALRLVRFAAAMLLWGAGCYVAVVAPPGLAARLKPRLAALPVAVAALLVVATVLRLPLTAASFGDGWPDALRSATISAVLGTGTGSAWRIDAALAALLAASLLSARLRWPVATVLAGLTLAASSLTGHAVTTGAAWGPLHPLNDAAHLLAAGLWLGALPPLALTLRHEGGGPDAVTAIRRFAVAGQVAVAIILVTGIANAVLIKQGEPLSWSSAYDVLLLLKLAIVLGMIGLALVNHLYFLPRLAAGSNAAARALRRGALLEVALGFTAVGLVSVFGMLDPA